MTANFILATLIRVMGQAVRTRPATSTRIADCGRMRLMGALLLVDSLQKQAGAAGRFERGRSGNSWRDVSFPLPFVRK